MIDSWTWIEYWRGGETADTAAKYIESDEDAIVSTINLAETYYWILRFYGKGPADTKLNTVTTRCQAIPVDSEIAVEAARIRKRLGLALADSLILSTARCLNARLVTGDTDFSHIEGAIFIG